MILAFGKRNFCASNLDPKGSKELNITIVPFSNLSSVVFVYFNSRKCFLRSTLFHFRYDSTHDCFVLVVFLYLKSMLMKHVLSFRIGFNKKETNLYGYEFDGMTLPERYWISLHEHYEREKRKLSFDIRTRIFNCVFVFIPENSMNKLTHEMNGTIFINLFSIFSGWKWNCMAILCSDSGFQYIKFMKCRWSHKLFFFALRIALS